jgi:hypothetical protein
MATRARIWDSFQIVSYSSINGFGRIRRDTGLKIPTGVLEVLVRSKYSCGAFVIFEQAAESV